MTPEQRKQAFDLPAKERFRLYYGVPVGGNLFYSWDLWYGFVKARPMYFIAYPVWRLLLKILPSPLATPRRHWLWFRFNKDMFHVWIQRMRDHD